MERLLVRTFGKRANMADHGVEVRNETGAECWIWRRRIYVWTK